MKQQQHILQVISSLHRGGAETFLMNLYDHIDHDKYRFSFLLCQQGGDYLERILADHNQVFFIPPRNQGFFAYRKNLKQFFRQHAGDFDVVHQHLSSLTSIECLEEAARAGIPVRIAHVHSSFPEGSLHRLLHYYHQFRIKNAATNYWACSSTALSWAFKLPVVRKHAIIVKNGIETKKFAFNVQNRESTRLALGVKPDEVLIGHVGRFHPVKNHKFLIEIFAQYVSVNNNAKLVLVGDGELRKEIEALVTQKNIGGKVIFTGVRQDIPNLLQAMDLLIFPSFKEGLPLSLVEAQCAGLSVVASDTIDHDCSILPSFQFCSLNDSPKQWLDKIKNAVSLTDLTKRAEAWKQVRDDGYDIEDTCSFITKTY